MPDFIPGLRLCERYFHEAIRPVLDEHFPDLRYSAALIGPGSDVLGFDTEMSRDHAWGPRAMLFLPEADFWRRDIILASLRQRLPRSFAGYSTHFLPLPGDSPIMQEAGPGPFNPLIEIFTIKNYFVEYLGYDIDQELQISDWLSFPEQKLLSLVSGAVFHDDLELQSIRQRLHYYPHDVWLYILAAGWERIGEEEHLMGRAGYAGDEIGSALIAARLVRDLMRLCFLMEKQYAPYPKWLGTAFRRLACAGEMEPLLRQALSATNWQDRDTYLAPAYQLAAARHNALGITGALPDKIQPFHDRPFHVIEGERFASAIREQIKDPVVLTLTERRTIGNIDQVSDNTVLLNDTAWHLQVRKLYE